jgi:hypothetical protein
MAITLLLDGHGKSATVTNLCILNMSPCYAHSQGSMQVIPLSLASRFVFWKAVDPSSLCRHNQFLASTARKPLASGAASMTACDEKRLGNQNWRTNFVHHISCWSWILGRNLGRKRLVEPWMASPWDGIGEWLPTTRIADPIGTNEERVVVLPLYVDGALHSVIFCEDRCT